MPSQKFTSETSKKALAVKRAKAKARAEAGQDMSSLPRKKLIEVLQNPKTPYYTVVNAARELSKLPDEAGSEVRRGVRPARRGLEIKSVCVVRLPAIRLVARDRAVVVDVVDVVAVLVPDLPRGDPSVIQVADDVDAIQITKCIIVRRNNDFGVPVSIDIGNDRIFVCCP